MLIRFRFPWEVLGDKKILHQRNTFLNHFDHVDTCDALHLVSHASNDTRFGFLSYFRIILWLLLCSFGFLIGCFVWKFFSLNSLLWLLELEHAWYLSLWIQIKYLGISALGLIWKSYVNFYYKTGAKSFLGMQMLMILSMLMAMSWLLNKDNPKS